MKRRNFIRLVGFWAASSVAALAQSKAVPAIAVVGSFGQGAIDALKDGLQEFGFIDRKTIVVLGSPAIAASPEAVSEMLSDLIAQNIDVIFASGAVAGTAAKAATSTIPVVCLTGDLVGAGLVQSLARPGGNITGISMLTAEASAKRLEVLKQLVPALERVAAFYNTDDPTAPLSLNPLETAAKTLGIALQTFGVRSESDFNNAFAASVAARAQAIALTSNGLFDIAGRQIAELALQNKLATISFANTYPKVGGLASYGPDIRASYRRMAYFIARILRGTKPADLPVEQPTKFSLGINLNTARALGIAVPDSLLASAGEVIE
jgi:putative tryptophan/tyrosine transport system substrate-binding protein